MGRLTVLLAAIFCIIGDVGHFAIVGSLAVSQSARAAAWLVFLSVSALSMALTALGLTAIFGRQSQAMDKLGATGFILAFLGTLMMYVHQWANTFVTMVLGVISAELRWEMSPLSWPECAAAVDGLVQ